MTRTLTTRDRWAALALPLFRVYLRHFPIRVGKMWAWNAVVHPYLAWRPLPVVSTTRDGARFPGRLYTPLHRFLYFFGVFEPAISAFMREYLRPGDVAIDVGANIGVHTTLLSRRVGPAGRVHAIEASPSIFAALRDNLTRNGAANVVTHHMAVLDAPGTVTVFLHDMSNDGGTTVVTTVAERRRAAAEAVVEARPLDQIVPAEDLRRTRLIKIDVEGAEWLVAQGMAAALPALPPDCAIIMEVSPRALENFGASVAALVAIFTAHGFRALVFPLTYTPERHLDRPLPPPRPFGGVDFDIADLLFIRGDGPR